MLSDSDYQDADKYTNMALENPEDEILQQLLQYAILHKLSFPVAVAEFFLTPEKEVVSIAGPVVVPKAQHSQAELRKRGEPEFARLGAEYPKAYLAEEVGSNDIDGVHLQDMLVEARKMQAKGLHSNGDAYLLNWMLCADEGFRVTSDHPTLRIYGNLSRSKEDWTRLRNWMF